jgi:acetolactate synthase-1/2/3 large subunit
MRSPNNSSDEGVRQVFGVPSVQLDYAVDALTHVSDQIAHWNTRHEQATS